MHEIRATVPLECVPEATRLAHASGIERVSVAEVFVHGPNAHRRMVTVETSTPKATAFVDALLNSRIISQADCVVTSREVRAILDDQRPSDVTRPMSEPFTDVIQDLWQLSHVTASYIARAASGGIILASGVVENNQIAIVVAALFLPFLSQVLAVSFGVWTKDRRLIAQGATAVLVSTVSAIGAGAVVAWIEGGPILFQSFKGPLASFGVSALIGITAGLSSADDTGRRYLIGVAASVQLAIFPAWFGAALVVGLPTHEILYSRLLSFAINLATISAAALAAYAALKLGRGRGWAAPRSGRGPLGATPET